jgi:two-component system, chemotaxis family, response regulator Rcp1
MNMTGPVVYVEDEPDDAFFMRRAFEQCAPDVELRILANGEEALQFFAKTLEPEEQAAPRPGLVLLDMNLPGLSGLEVLLQIRSQPALQRLPVIMYSSSNQMVDIVEAYRRGCSAYLVKPHSPEKLRDLVNALTAFWIKENQYPPPTEL